MKYFRHFSFLLLLVSTTGFSQLQCGTDHMIREYYQAHPKEYSTFVQNELMLNNSLLQKSDEDTNLYIIPVVFHVLHLNGPENISDEQIIDGINIMNRDMQKMNADTADIIPEFRHLAGKLRIEFRLATIDPDGNCTNGIDRIYTSRTNYGDDSAKINPWPRDKYLNIWTAKALLQGWAGYAYYPSAADGNEIRDGLMVLANYIGSIGTSNELRSRTLTHEVGHWLDLGHPWNTTINISINVGLACGDDLVSDTPITKGHTTCPNNLRIPDCTIDTLGAHYVLFDDVTTSSGTADPDSLTVGLENFVNGPFEAVGVGSNTGQNGAFSFSGWDTGAPDGAVSYGDLTGAINTAKYYEWTIEPDTGYTATLSGMTFRVKRTADGPRPFAVRSSVNLFSSNLNAQPEAGSDITTQTGNVLFFETDDADPEYTLINVSFTGSAYTLMYNPVTFRFYGWNSESASGEFAIDSVSLVGTTGVIENIQNYMEYSYCCNMWTKGQCARMSAALNSPLSGRNNLWSQENLEATGVLEPTPCAPQADFYASANRICTGKEVTFTMNEVNAQATSQSWAFEGGTPATSSAPNPTILYSTPGVYSVSLTTTNANGSTTLTREEFIIVDDNTTINAENDFYDDFGSETLFADNWQIVNPDSNANTWTFDAANGWNNAAGSVYVNGEDAFYLETDQLVSPYYNLSSNSLSLNFKLAAASKDSDLVDDKLAVYFKKNCDSPWALVETLHSDDLYNNPDQSAPFIPGAGTTWSDYSINIGTAYRTDNFQFKMIYYSDYYTNRIYIDHINIGQPLGIAENDAAQLNMQLFPVPASGTFQLTYHLPTAAMTQVKVMDVTGKLIYESAEQFTEPGEQEMPVTLVAGKGVYFVSLIVNGRNYTLRQIIE